MSFTFQLPYPDAMLSPNAHVGWKAKEEYRSTAKTLGYVQAYNAMTDGQELEEAKKYAITIMVNPPDHRWRDLDNIHSSLKHHIDGACQALRINDRLIRRTTVEMLDPVEKGSITIILDRYVTTKVALQPPV